MDLSPASPPVQPDSVSQDSHPGSETMQSHTRVTNLPTYPRNVVLDSGAPLHLLSPSPALYHLRRVCGQLYFQVLAQILSLGLFRRFTATDILPSTLYGVVTHRFGEAMAHAMYGSATILARFYHCAAHGLDLNWLTQFVPIHLPIAALVDVDLPMPTLSLVLGYPANPFLHRDFPAVRAAIHAAETFCKWIDYHVLWLAECIFRSSLKGLTTEWNFGAVLSMRKIDFIRLIAALEPTQEPRNYLLGLGGRLFVYHDLDMKVARLIRPWFTHIGVLQGPTQVAAALYPLEHSLAGPMDVVMSTGFQRMEEDSEAVQQL